MLKINCFIILIILFSPLMLFAQDGLYKIYSVELRREVSMAEMTDKLAHADVVFFGEEHNDSVAHVLQLELLKGLHAIHGQRLSLSMEMFQTDVQLVLDEYLAGQITERNLKADARPWKNYPDYQGMVEFAKEKGLYVLAANAPSRYTNRVTREGITSLMGLAKEAKKYLAPLPIDTLRGPYYDKFNSLMGGHNGMGNLQIYQSQNVWDATMAWKIARLAKRRQVKQILHLNGRFHSDEKLGTYAHLQGYAKKLKLSNIAAFPHESFANPDWATWEHLADFIIITDPNVNRSF